MSAPTPFVNSLRARKGVVRIGEGAAGPVLQLRVELADLWDVVRVDAPASEPVLALKVNALQALAPKALFHDDYMIKLRGHEILDETQSLVAVGALDGSTFLLARRHRQPVR